jgi:hypothetical protein
LTRLLSPKLNILFIVNGVGIKPSDSFLLYWSYLEIIFFYIGEYGNQCIKIRGSFTFYCAHELLVARELDRFDVGEDRRVVGIDVFVVFDKNLEGEVVIP